MGTKLSKGCLGGHGYCASPYFSLSGAFYSAVAIGTGLIIATVRGWLPFWVSSETESRSAFYAKFSFWVSLILFALMGLYSFYYILMQLIKERGIDSSEALVSTLIGIIYGGGLLFGGALRPSIVVGFLNMGSWNPALGVLMLTATVIKVGIFYLVLGAPAPEREPGYMPIPVHEGDIQNISQYKDKRLIAGAACFGIGWGLSGLCPGTLLGGGFFVYSHALLLTLGMLIGATIFKLVKERWEYRIRLNKNVPPLTLNPAVDTNLPTLLVDRKREDQALSSPTKVLHAPLSAPQMIPEKVQVQKPHQEQIETPHGEGDAPKLQQETA
jgi:uncharacterized membrane protein YedE/YeeE